MFDFKDLCNKTTFDIVNKDNAIVVFARSTGLATTYLKQCYAALCLTDLTVSTNHKGDFIRVEYDPNKDMQAIADEIALQLSNRPTPYTVSNLYDCPRVHNFAWACEQLAAGKEVFNLKWEFDSDTYLYSKHNTIYISTPDFTWSVWQPNLKDISSTAWQLYIT